MATQAPAEHDPLPCQSQSTSLTKTGVVAENVRTQPDVYLGRGVTGAGRLVAVFLATLASLCNLQNKGLVRPSMRCLTLTFCLEHRRNSVRSFGEIIFLGPQTLSVMLAAVDLFFHFVVGDAVPPHPTPPLLSTCLHARLP